MLVVVSVQAWDGHRILGVFSSKKKAVEHVELAGFKLESDNLYFDIVRKNAISSCQEIICDGSSRESAKNCFTVATTRKHLYD